MAAKNYTLKEAYELLREGNAAARQDIGKRFPLLATASTDEIMSVMIDFVTARKIETGLKNLHGLNSDDVAPVVEDVAPVTEKVAPVVEKAAPVEKKSRGRGNKNKEVEKVEAAPVVVLPTVAELDVMTDAKLRAAGKEMGLYERGIDLDDMYDLMVEAIEAAPAAKKSRGAKAAPVEENTKPAPGAEEFENFEDFE